MCVKRIFAQRLQLHINLPTTQFRQNSSSALLSQKSLNEYEEAVPKFLDSLPSSTFPAEVIEKIKKISEYTLKEKDNIAGPLTIHAYETLASPENMDNNSMNDIRILGWGADMVHSYYKILNDVDNNKHRRGKIYLWDQYDASLLRSSVYEVLANYFDKKPVYNDLVTVFNKAFLSTDIGNMIHSKKYRRDGNATLPEYNLAADYKMYHMFNIPFQLAMKLTAIDDEKSLCAVDSLCKDIGRLYQIQCDYLDCYAEDPDYPGLALHSKDIQNGKRTWLLIQAMLRCNSAKKVVLTSCYGSNDPAHIERVKLLYDQLEIPRIFKIEEQVMLQRISNNIATKLNDTKLPPELFKKVFDFLKDNVL